MSLENDIRTALNCACAENESNTPDFILARYLLASLKAFNEASNAREEWYGAKHGPTINDVPPPGIIT